VQFIFHYYLGAYESWNNLVNYVEKVIQQFGEEYVINFA